VREPAGGLEEEILDHLDFTQFDADNAGSLAVLVGDLGGRSGIYWLSFDDGTEYVGQSVEVVRRLAHHRRHQPGRPVRVAFAPVPRERLDEAERWFIEERDEATHGNLRNKLITRFPGGRCPMTYQITEGLTVSLPWDRAARDLLPEGWSPIAGGASPSQAARWDKLRRLSDWPEVRGFLREFLRETVSAPHLTVGRLWTISALPQTASSASWFRYCTLNVGRIEAIFIGRDADQGVTYCWNLEVPEDKDLPSWGRLLSRIDPKNEYIGAEVHQRYSEPVLSLEIAGGDLARALLREPLVADLSYKFNTRYLRQGTIQRADRHNPLLAADLLC
jgi:hypothetical protein